MKKLAAELLKKIKKRRGIRVPTIHLPKNAAFRHEKLSVKTASNIPDEKGAYGSLRVFVKVDGSPYTEKAAKTELSFLFNQGIVDEQWQVIPWGNGFAVAPVINISDEDKR